MKITFIIMLSSIVIIFSSCKKDDTNPVTQPNNNLPTDGLIAYYPFSGNTNDESGKGIHGLGSGITFTSDRVGNSNKACLFDDNTDKITLPGGTIGMTTSLDRTISLWAKPTSIPTAPNNGGLISQYLHGVTSESNFFIGLDQESGSYRLNVAGNGTGRLDVPLASNPNGQWLHIVVIMKAGANNTKVYVNNNLLQTGTLNYNTDTSVRSPVIGNIDGSSNSNGFPGAIDDIRIYNRVLSNSEIQLLNGEK